MTGRYQYRLRGGADEPIAQPPARQHDARPAARASDAAVAAARRRLRHGAGRQVAPRLPAALRAAEERLPGVLRPDVAAASTTSPTATPRARTTCSRARPRCIATGYLTDLISDARGGLHRPQRGARQPFLLSRALHRAALALGDARRRGRGAAHREDLSHRRRLGRDLPARMIRHMDEGIGRILAALRAGGADETRSSSSPATTAASASPTPGRWSARRWTCSRAASACPTSCAGRRACGRAAPPTQLAITMDWVATFLEAAGVRAAPDYPLDGVSLLPVLERPGRRASSASSTGA